MVSSLPSSRETFSFKQSKFKGLRNINYLIIIPHLHYPIPSFLSYAYLKLNCPKNNELIHGFADVASSSNSCHLMNVLKSNSETT